MRGFQRRETDRTGRRNLSGPPPYRRSLQAEQTSDKLGRPWLARPWRPGPLLRQLRRLLRLRRPRSWSSPELGGWEAGATTPPQRSSPS